MIHRRTFALLPLALFACHSAAGPSAPSATGTPQAPVAPPAADAVKKLAVSSNALGFDLYKRHTKEPGNLVLSPASITTALAMTWGGAKGETAAQMQKVLHVEGSPREVMETSGRLVRSLEDPSRPIVFRVANQLFGEKTFSFERPFLDDTARAYGAPIEGVDFIGAPEPARARINEWVEGKTEKRIKDLVPSGGITGATRLVLVNAIYFLGDWELPFEKERTHDAPFSTGATTKKNVPTMAQTNHLRFAEKDGVSAIELPYAGGDLSMLLLVPDQVDGLAALEGALDAQKLDGFVAALQTERIFLSLPKFEIAPAASFSLGRDLRALGMLDAFDAGKADFTGIANPASPSERLSIGDVFHKGFVEVNEKGTEAAAATAVTMTKAAAAAERPREIRIDRPFFFVIRDNASGLVLFMGRVTDPTQK